MLAGAGDCCTCSIALRHAVDVERINVSVSSSGRIFLFTTRHSSRNLRLKSSVIVTFISSNAQLWALWPNFNAFADFPLSQRAILGQCQYRNAVASGQFRAYDAGVIT